MSEISKTYFSLNTTQIEQLKGQLKGLLATYDKENQHTTWIEKTLFEYYSQPHRRYHNLHHIHSLLELAHQYQEHIQDPNQIRWAIWFHDVIYDPKRHDNEFESAELAVKALEKLSMDSDSIATIKALILMTEAHNSQQQSSDFQVFSDFDLVILGASETVYHAYAQAIREEYHWVPEERYRQGRRKVLERFIQRPQIYFTPEIQADYEQTARKNIAWELRQL